MERARWTLRGLLALAVVSSTSCGDAAATSGPGEHDGGTVLDAYSGAAAAMPSFCPSDLHKRTPEQVLDDHRAALAAGDYDAVYCNYAADAVVIGDGGIDVGHEQIRASLEFFGTLFGGTQPVVVQQVVVDAIQNKTHMVRLLFTIDTPCVIVPDGVDTYVIRQGQILSQTSHAFPVFLC